MSDPDLTTGAPPSGDAMVADVGPAQDGEDAGAFRRIFEAVFDELVRFVERRAEHTVVEDVVAETFLAGLVVWSPWGHRNTPSPPGPGARGNICRRLG